MELRKMATAASLAAAVNLAAVPSLAAAMNLAAVPSALAEGGPSSAPRPEAGALAPATENASPRAQEASPDWEDFFPTWGEVRVLDAEDLSHLSAISLGRALDAAPGLTSVMSGSPGQSETVGLLIPWGDDTELVVEGRPLGTAARSPWGLELFPLGSVERLEIATGMIASLAAGGAPGGVLRIRQREGPPDVPVTDVGILRGARDLRITRGALGRSFVRQTRVFLTGQSGRSQGLGPAGDPARNDWEAMSGNVNGPVIRGARTWLRLRRAEVARGFQEESGDDSGIVYGHEKAKLADADLALAGGELAGRSWRALLYWSLREEERTLLGMKSGGLRWMRRRGGELRLRFAAPDEEVRSRTPLAFLLGGGAEQQLGDSTRRKGWVFAESETPGPRLSAAAAARWEMNEGAKGLLSACIGLRHARGAWRYTGEVGSAGRPAMRDSLLPRETPAARERWKSVELRAVGPIGAGWTMRGELAWRAGEARGDAALLGGGTGGPGIAEGVGYWRMSLAEASVGLERTSAGGTFSVAYAGRRMRGEREGSSAERIPWQAASEFRGWLGREHGLLGGDLRLRGDVFLRYMDRRWTEHGGRTMSPYVRLDVRLGARLKDAEFYGLLANALDARGADRPDDPLPSRNTSFGVRWVLWD